MKTNNKKLVKTLIVAGLIVSGLSFGVGRVGNSFLGDSQLGFTSAIPSLFCQGPFCLTAESDSNVFLKPIVMMNMTKSLQVDLSNSKVVVSPFAESFPNLKNFSRNQILNYVSDLNRYPGQKWTIIKSSDSCVDSYLGDIGQFYVGIAVWGADGRNINKGIALTGDHFVSIQNAIQNVIEKVKLDPGACSWK